MVARPMEYHIQGMPLVGGVRRSGPDGEAWSVCRCEMLGMFRFRYIMCYSCLDLDLYNTGMFCLCNLPFLEVPWVGGAGRKGRLNSCLGLMLA